MAIGTGTQGAGSDTNGFELMQPIYITLTSSGSSPWKVPNWHATPQELSFQVISAGSSYIISATLEDPTGVYPSPNSSAPTAFTMFAGSSNAIFTLGSTVTFPIGKPIAGYQVTLNALSTLGGVTKITAVILQSGIG
jgi:hypothetical protein